MSASTPPYSSLEYNTQTTTAFINSELQRVSRSFAKIIPLLDELSIPVGTAYLICRLCDNCEDTVNISAEDRAFRFETLLKAFEKETPRQELARTLNTLTWEGISPEELSQFEEEKFITLFEIFDTLTEIQQNAIRTWAIEMSEGMNTYANRPATHFETIEQVDILKTEAHFDHYCYYVAGTVGRMLTEMVREQYKITEEELPSEEINTYAETFGRALQSINILKDFADDKEERKVSFLPRPYIGPEEIKLQGMALEKKKQLFSKVLSDLNGGLEYLARLPKRTTEYKQFCLGALSSAFATLEFIIKNHTHFAQEYFNNPHKKFEFKITRETMTQEFQRFLTKVLGEETAEIQSFKEETHAHLSALIKALK